ncbi:MAG: hypothetical protein ABJA74_08585 [Lapillicoccus sp.]
MQIGFFEAFAACAVAAPAFAVSLSRVTGNLLDEPRTLSRRADAVAAYVLADLLDPDWS